MQDYFEAQGYKTEMLNNQYQGFFHGTGHGLGLEIHENPRVGKIDNILETGHVVTVEPGLYYPEIGGCRIEDVVRITETGYELLSQRPLPLAPTIKPFQILC